MALTDNLKAFYNCDETSGTTLHDSVASHNGTLQSNASFSSGWLVCATAFNTSGGVDIGQVSAIEQTTYPISYSVQFNTSATGTQNNSNMKIGLNCEASSSPYSQHSLVMQMDGSGSVGKIVPHYRNSSGTDSADSSGLTSTAYNDGSDHFAVVTISSSGAGNLYIDGNTTPVLTFSASGSMASSKYFTIGNDDAGSSGGIGSVFKGKIRRMGFWNRELTSTEQATLYNSGNPLDYSGLTGGSPTAPTVTSSAVTSIGSTTATGNGNVTSDGGATITERGVVVGTSANPTTSNSKFTASGTTGAFTGSITGLSASTAYHCRAYAINSVGTSYGADESFTTTSSGGGAVPQHIQLNVDYNSSSSVWGVSSIASS